MPVSTLGICALKPHHDYYFRDGNVCFWVENTIFRLHRHFFDRESKYFSHKLNPSGDEDGSPDSPYKIHDVTSNEFAQFVWIWYNPAYSYSKQTKEKWLIILRLATEWDFPEIRKLAIRHLEKFRLEPIEKITTYKKYAVDHDLLLPSYICLCRKDKLPSPQEGRILTLDTVLRLANAREKVLLSASARGCKTPTTATAPDDLVREIVAELFELSPRPDDQAVGAEGQTRNNGSASDDNPGPSEAEVVTVKQPIPAKKGNAQETPQSGSWMNGLGINGNANKGKKRQG